MRFLFIDPIGDKESTDLNIGIAYCASAAIEQGHLISVVDLVNTMPPDPLAAIKTAVENFQPDAVGISITNMSFNTSKGYVDDIKRYFKGMVVLGGPEITALAARSLELMPNADIAVIGEGEITLVELLAAIGKNASLESVNGLVWRKSNNIITNPPRPFIADLDKVLFPNYDVFGVSAMDLYPIVTSRGCPYGCIFCFSHLGKKWRARTAENIIEELKIAKNKYGARIFHICDASFNVDIQRVEKFCRLLIEDKLDMPWVIQGFRADRVTERMMSCLREARCGRIWVGIETLEEDVFKSINKGETLEQIKDSIALMKKYNIEIFGYMLMGLPGDTFRKTLRSFENARKFDLDVLAYSSCVPFTGTAIEKWAKDNAVMLSDSYNISSIGTQYSNIAFMTKDFTEAERRKARRILNIKSGSYNEPGMNTMLFKIKKWALILRYDSRNLLYRLKQSFRYRRKFSRSVDSINLKRGIYFFRLPDGTWGLGKNTEGHSVASKFFLDVKRMTMSRI